MDLIKNVGPFTTKDLNKEFCSEELIEVNLWTLDVVYSIKERRMFAFLNFCFYFGENPR